MAADFNADGNLDIAAGATTQTIETALLFGKGDGTFQATIFPSNLSGFGALFTASLTNDGHADLVSNNQVALGNGNGTFTWSHSSPSISHRFLCHHAHTGPYTAFEQRLESAAWCLFHCCHIAALTVFDQDALLPEVIQDT